MKMQEVIVSLVSGLAGVLVGALIQIIYSNHSEKRQYKNEYKKFCINEWNNQKNELKNLIENPHVYNSMIFRLSLQQKIENLSFLKDKNNEKKILELQRAISDADKRLSLGDFCEEALNIGNDELKKKKLVRSVLRLSTEVLKRISQF